MSLVYLLIFALMITGTSFAYAEPLGNIEADVRTNNNDSFIVHLTWDGDPQATNYEIGCVSCIPNTSEVTSGVEITMHDVTPFPNTSNALLYIISYDSENHIVGAKQIFLNLDD